jgi:hypothetical protein
VSAGTSGYAPQAVDLSAFDKRATTVPPPPLPPRHSEAEAPAPTEAGAADSPPARRPPRARRPATEAKEAEKSSSTDRKVQFFVHLPPEQHKWLRERAAAIGWPKREVILDAFVAHRDELEGHDPDAERRRQAGLPPRTPGRRKEIGGIPSNVYMGQAEAEVLDRHATTLGMSRSQMVSELLRLAAVETAAGAGPSRRGGK